MGKCFRSDDLDQTLLLPPLLHDWLPEQHLACFLVEVVDALDLGAIQASYDEQDGRGQAAYAPAMMVRVLLYGYCTGAYSSRKIEAETYEDVAFRYLAADEHPDHSTLAEFRKRHLEALAALFTQGLTMPNDSLKHTLRIRHDFGLDSSTIDATSSLPAVPILDSIQAIFMDFHGPRAQLRHD
jgi:transposase